MSSLVRDFRIPLLLALVLGLAIRIYLIQATPFHGNPEAGKLSSYNDEIAHSTYTAHILEHRSLPTHIETIQQTGALERGHYESYQPPAYYLIHAAISDVLGLEGMHDITVSGRWLSLIIFGLVFFVYFFIARELRLTSIETVAGFLFLALNGVLLRFSTTAGNESLFWLCAGAIFLVTLRLQRDSVSVGDWIAFVVIITAAIYAKLSSLVLMPLPFLLLFDARRFRQLTIAAFLFVAILLLTLPVWLRNISEFGGILPLSAGFGAPACRIPGLEFVGFTLRSFVFPWTELWRGFMSAVLFMSPLAAIGILYFRGRRSPNRYSAVFSTGFMLAAAAFLWLNFRYDQAEARYLFAAWPSFALVASRACSTVTHLWILLAVLAAPLVLFLL